MPSFSGLAFRLFLSLLLLPADQLVFSEECNQRISDKTDINVYHDLLDQLKETSFELESVRQLGDVNHFKIYPGNPVLEPGEHGMWDSGAIGSMTVVTVDRVFHMYYEAWGSKESNDDGVDYSTLQIGHAVSLDGIHWLKDPNNPVIPKGTISHWDAKGTWDPFVIHENRLFKMWYGGGIHPYCDWGYAESHDGRLFVKRGQISNLHHVEDDHVVHDAQAGRYYMYYWDRQKEPKGLVRAESKNEIDFDFANSIPITINGIPQDVMHKFTHVLREGDKWYMFYADFVRPNCAESTTQLAMSDDGVHWKVVNRDLFAGHDAEVIRADDNLFLVYYGPRGHFDQLDSDVRVAIYAGELANLAHDSQGEE